MSEVMERPAVTTPNRAPMTPDAMIEKYVALRDRKKAIEDRHKTELAPFNELLDKLEGWLLEALNAADLQSMRSPHGTAYKSVRTAAKVTDWKLALDFILERKLYELLEARVSKTAAFAIIDETKLPIPGVDTTSEVVVNIRRASGGGK